MLPDRGGRNAGRCVLFWDYDTQWGVERSRSGRNGGDLGAREFANTDRILELLDQYRVPACFAVVGAAALPGQRPYHDPQQVRRISAEGHEVASHSHQHEWLPGLDPAALRATLQQSRDALEQCIGAPVDTFVPPFNEPRDYPARLSISLSERRDATAARTDLPALCDALRESGYRSCRVAYQPLPLQAVRRVAGPEALSPRRPVRVRGVQCLRLNAGCGFGPVAWRTLHRCARSGGVAVLYGHPHSLDGPDGQNQSQLVACLKVVDQLRDEGRLWPCRPRDLLGAA
jgi:peptidoglycan/xylan/chitin deacetylase (PgdA/CDA1 family)